MIKELPGDKLVDAIGCFIVLYSRPTRSKYVIKLISVDMENSHMRYEIISGSKKGMVRTGKFVNDRPFRIFDEDSLVKALLEV